MSFKLCKDCGYPERCHPLIDGESGYKCEEFTKDKEVTRQ